MPEELPEEQDFELQELRGETRHLTNKCQRLQRELTLTQEVAGGILLTAVFVWGVLIGFILASF